MTRITRCNNARDLAPHNHRVLLAYPSCLGQLCSLCGLVESTGRPYQSMTGSESQVPRRAILGACMQITAQSASARIRGSYPAAHTLLVLSVSIPEFCFEIPLLSPDHAVAHDEDQGRHQQQLPKTVGGRGNPQVK